MKSKLKRILVFGFVLAIAVILTGCTSVSYVGNELDQGTVGINYSTSIAFAEGAAGINYALKEGSELPAGLSLSSEGQLSGVPSEAVNGQEFVVVASAGGKKAEATFSITIARGSVIYEGFSLRVLENAECNASVARASNALDITYSLAEGQLPAGLALSSDGTLTGTPAARESQTVKIAAEAKDCETAIAEVTIEVSRPWIEYEAVTLPLGTAGRYYTALIASASGASDITYRLSRGATLPKGLSLNEDGLIYGVPLESVVNHTFTVQASRSGFASGETEMSITIRSAADVSTASGFISFAGGALVPGEASGYYYLSSSDKDNEIVNAKATNRNEVRYAITDGALPRGLTLYQDGTVFGTPASDGDFQFTITASAENCEPVSREYTMSIIKRVTYAAARSLPDGKVGEAYSVDIGDAAMDTAGTAVKYSVKNTAALPAGITVSEDGIVSGTPSKSSKSYNFVVVASAEGYSDAECEVSMRVFDTETTVANRRLEAELIDLTGKTGAGYSGGANEEGMVQSGGSFGASNGYFVGFLHGPVSLEFQFKSSVQASGVNLMIGLDSEIGPIVLNPSNFAVSLNGEPVNYGAISVQGVAGDGATGYSGFKEYTLMTNATLNEGDNSLVITILNNNLLGDRSGGPGIDYIQIDGTDATISWTPCKYNLNRFGEWEKK